MKKYFLIFIPILFLNACTFDDAVWRINNAILVLTGGSSQSAPEKAKVSASKPSLYAITAQRAKQNAEVLTEMYRVIYLQEPRADEFTSLVDTLNQGASLEGIYNGLIHSSHYRELEKAHPGSNAKALQFFVEELVRTEVQLATPTSFTADSAKPLSVPVEPTGDESEIDFPNKNSAAPSTPTPTQLASPTKEQVDQLFHEYAHNFAGASYLTLKRVLGDELLELMSQKSHNQKDPKELSRWYGKFVHRMAAFNVDFGLALRNNPDEKFHEGWAESVSGDQLRWEVLNRIHRLINSMENSK